MVRSLPIAVLLSATLLAGCGSSAPSQSPPPDPAHPTSTGTESSGGAGGDNVVSDPDQAAPDDPQATPVPQ